LRSATLRAHAATEFVSLASTQLLFDHSRRGIVWTSPQAERMSVDHDAELLYVGAVFHDVGRLEGRSAHEANDARTFLERHDLPKASSWTGERPISRRSHDRRRRLSVNAAA
jgi:hypothetical protein